MAIGTLLKVSHSLNAPLFNWCNPCTFSWQQIQSFYFNYCRLHSLAISQYIDFNIWRRVFHYLCGTSLSLLSKSASIYMCPESLLYNNKPQIHQPPCQVSSMGNRAFTCYALSCGIPWTDNSSLTPLSFIIPFLSLTSQNLLLIFDLPLIHAVGLTVIKYI